MAEVIALELPANLRYLGMMRACVQEALSYFTPTHNVDTLTYHVQLALQEACSNIIHHAYRGTTGRIMLHFAVDLEAQKFYIDIYDTGQYFDMTQVPRPNLQEAQVHGYGLHLMHALLDEVHYERLGTQNHWHLVKYMG